MGSISKPCLNSETSSEESDHQPEKFKEESTGIGRFYECNFCKRGFTNAQALGGHMNIHRKDRAKIKQKTSKSSILSKSGEECMNPRYFEHLSSDHQRYFSVPIGAQMNYQFYVPTSNPNFPLEYDLSHLSDSATLRKDNLNLLEDHETANLSMQIDHYSDHHQEASEGRNTNWKENELDLELRLG